MQELSFTDVTSTFYRQKVKEVLSSQSNSIQLLLKQLNGIHF